MTKKNRENNSLKIVVAIVASIFLFLVIGLPLGGKVLQTNIFHSFDVLELFIEN